MRSWKIGSGLFAGVLALGAACVPDYEVRSQLDVPAEVPQTPEPPQTPDPMMPEPPAEPPMSPPPSVEVPTWWQDVEPVVRAECHLCHGAEPLYGAPMALASYEDVLAMAVSDSERPVHVLMSERIVPNSGLPPMPPRANGNLTEAQIAMIIDWSKNGAPEGVPPEPPPEEPPPEEPPPEEPPPEEPPPPTEPLIEIPVVAPQAAVRPGAEDLYACFRTIIQTDEPLHAVEIVPQLDKLQVLHHLLLFRDGGRNYPESRVGLFCAADTVIQPDWELLHGWAPGGGPMVLPPEAGVLLEDGDHLVIQIHYNNYGSEPQIDASGMILKATPNLRPNDAAVLGVGTENFSLPPGQSEVSRSGDCQLSQPMHIFNYSPHMHLLGKAAKLERIRDGQLDLLAEVPDFAFEAQENFPTSIDLVPGDTLRATCTWDTTPRNNNTGFGEGTEDEMCYMFVAHYPPFGEYSCGD